MTYANAEALKWLAFACMVVDHASKVFGPWDWATPIGRIAFPLFAFIIARHLDKPDTAGRLLLRLLVVGVLATLPHMLTLTHGHLLPLNILFTFALVVVLCALPTWWLVLPVFAVASPFVDYAWPGVLLVVACGWYWRAAETAGEVTGRGWLMLAAALAGLCIWNGNAWALLAVPLVIAAVRYDWRVPRLRWFFWIAYPLHLAVLALLKLAA